MRRFKLPLTAVALLTAAVLAAGGCSSDSKDSGSPKDPKGTKDTKSAAASSTSTTTTTFKFVGNDSKAWCEADRKVQEELSTPPPGGASPAVWKERFGKMIAALDDLHAKASDEIKDSVATIRDAYKGVLPALEKANYDPNKLDAKSQQALSSPEFEKAADRLSAYERQVCKYDPSSSPTTAGATPTTKG
ncbi:MAG: hypothetical protein IT197_03570 [Acidimicrobiia bacterium]|nr:hypothetical protein [Acidimicrobiia bacterium]